MRSACLVIACSLLPVALSAQVDSASADTAQQRIHAVALGLDSRGGYAAVQVLDSADRTVPDTIRLETKRRIYRIITTRRAYLQDMDSLSDRLARARRERRNVFTYWSGIDAGINTFITTDGRFGDGPKAGPVLLNNPRSRWVSINFMEQKYEFGSHHAGFFWGLGLEFTGYHLSENVSLAYNGDSTFAVPVDQPQFTKNKLRQIGLRLPLMFEFNTKNAPLPADDAAWKKYQMCGNGYSHKGNFHFAAGVVGSWYFDTMYKQKFRDGGETRKVRDKGDYNLLPYRVSARAQIGIGGWNLFAEYGLTPLFEKGTAPEVMPVTVGLTLVGFN